MDKINKDLLISTSKNQSFDTDARIEEIEKSFDSSSSEYFSTYRKMRYGLLKINSKDTRLKFILTNYLGPGPPRIDDPAYMDLFTQMYKDFLFYYSRSEEGKNIPHIINRLHSLNILQDSLLKHDAVNSIAMAQLILLQNISENYSKGYFYKEALELLLDSISEQAVLPEYKVIADELKQHLTRLKIGTYPPELNLLSQNDEWKTMADFNGKYVYLNFCTPDNYSCMSEYPFMRALHRAHQHHLEFVTVLICNTHDEMKNFISSNQYKWSFLFYGNNDKLLKDYEVMAYPTSYLLDKEGRIIQSPAALPTEGLEQQLFHIMRARGDL